MTTTLLSQDAVEELLSEDIRLFRECLDVAAASAHKPLGAEAAFGSRTKASAVIDLAQAHAQVVFGSRTGYKTRRVRDLLVVEAHERLVVRFRKFADSTGFRFSRNDTDQTKDWEAQRPLVDFRESRALARATASMSSSATSRRRTSSARRTTAACGTSRCRRAARSSSFRARWTRTRLPRRRPGPRFGRR